MKVENKYRYFIYISLSFTVYNMHYKHIFKYIFWTDFLSVFNHMKTMMPLHIININVLECTVNSWLLISSGLRLSALSLLKTLV